MVILVLVVVVLAGLVAVVPAASHPSVGACGGLAPACVGSGCC